MKKKSVLFSFCLFAVFGNLAAFAEVKIIEADSTYIMGDNDSKVDARRVAVQEAKRKALESAGTYVESLTQVKNYQLSKDEVTAYTAGILETEVVSEQMRGTTERPEIYIKARCKIDTDVLTSQIDRYRKNEDLKEQLNVSVKENDKLKKERDALIKQLVAEKDKAKATQTRQKLEAVLAKEEANDATHTVWINIGSQLIETDENGRPIKQADLDNSAVILEKSIKTNPQDSRARFLLASIHQKSGNAAAAEAELKAAVQRNPSAPMLHLRLGILLYNQGKYQDALRELHFAERLQPRNAEMLFYTGMTFKKIGKCGRAVQYLNRFLKDPRANNFPRKKVEALQTVETCGGDRPGRVQRINDKAREIKNRVD